jgi:N-acetylmuramoyl-L-alanine amidase
VLQYCLILQGCNNMKLHFTLAFVLAGFCHLVMATTRLESLTVNEHAAKTSVRCQLTNNSIRKVFTLKQPDRLVIDFDQTTSTINFQNLNTNAALVIRLRSGHPDIKTLRLVLDLKQPATIRSSHWLPAQRNFQIDLQPVSIKPQRSPAPQSNLHPSTAMAGTMPHAILSQVNTPKLAARTPVPVSHAPSKVLRDVVIVLDPGHGGKDPGAIGPMRTAEKHVVLAIAKKLKQRIDSQPGMRAVLTRDGDYYVGLRARLNIARRHNADIFVAIHADAFVNHHSNGASVFALSQRGATSEAARWLAEKENYSELGGVNLSGLDDTNGVIRTVLIDLSQTATIGSSLRMGSRVLHGLDRITNLHNNKVEQARFVVLKSPDIPSILIETGFISNPREERNLTSEGYQIQLTRAIFDGIKNYFWDYPPHGSRIEAMTNVKTRHVVRFGESLPRIAAHYHVSVSALQAANHITVNRVRPGQTLNIPTSWS